MSTAYEELKEKERIGYKQNVEDHTKGDEVDSSEESGSDDEEVRIGICFFINTIHEIDMKNETVKVGLDVALFGKMSQQKLAEVFEEVYFAGTVDDNKDDELTPLQWPQMLNGVVGAELWFDLVVKVDMDFANFPFDVQDIHIRTYIGQTNYKLVSAEEFWEPGAGAKVGYATALLTTPTALISEEWALAAPIVYYGKSDINEAMEEFPQANAHLKIVREGDGYMKRFVSIMSLISLATLVPLCTPQMGVNDLLGFEVGLLFTVVAFQIIVSSYLPVTSTLSILDEYTTFLFSFTFLVMLVVAILGGLNPDMESFGFETTGIHIKWLFMIWAAAHLYFALSVKKLVDHRQAKLIAPQEPPKRAYKVYTAGSAGGPVRGKVVGDKSASASKLW